MPLRFEGNQVHICTVPITVSFSAVILLDLAIAGDAHDQCEVASPRFVRRLK